MDTEKVDTEWHIDSYSEGFDGENYFNKITAIRNTPTQPNEDYLRKRRFYTSPVPYNVDDEYKKIIHAHWIPECDSCGYIEEYCCSNCHDKMKSAVLLTSKYCPFCGAEMDEY